jgi:hypothetical protein
MSQNSGTMCISESDMQLTFSAMKNMFEQLSTKLDKQIESTTRATQNITASIRQVELSIGEKEEKGEIEPVEFKEQMKINDNCQVEASRSV